MTLDLIFTVLCMAYFAGGLTIGWYSRGWSKSRKREGDGRWD